MSGPTDSPSGGVAADSLESGAPETEPEAEIMSMGFGWEDTSSDRDWPTIFTGLKKKGYNAVDLAVGRPEWSLMPPVEGSKWRSANFSVPIGDIIQAAHDAKIEHVYLTVDCFMEGIMKDHPEWHSVRRDGGVVPFIPSAAAWKNEAPGEIMEEYIRDIAAMYGSVIDGIVLTELHWDEGSFTEADLNLFKEETGHADWTRRDDGTPHVGPNEREWLTDRMADNVSRWQSAAKRVPLIVDVRVDWENPTVGSLNSGQDYAKLSAAALGGISLWAYFFERDPERIAALRKAVEVMKPQPRISLGLWATGEQEDIDNATLQKALAMLDGYPRVQVVPYSKFTG